MDEIVVPLVAAALAFLVGVASTRQTRSLTLAERRLDLYDSLLLAARAFQAKATPFGDVFLTDRVRKKEVSLPPLPDYNAVETAVDRVRLVAPLSVGIPAQYLGIACLEIHNEISKYPDEDGVELGIGTRATNLRTAFADFIDASNLICGPCSRWTSFGEVCSGV